MTSSSNSTQENQISITNLYMYPVLIDAESNYRHSLIKSETDINFNFIALKAGTLTNV